MTKDDIIKLAREAGMPMAWISDSGVLNWADLLAFANLVAAAEREECAKLCDRVSVDYFTKLGKDHASWMKAAAEDCATDIRARGNT